MAVADGMPAAGLVLLSYPLHPPKKPENLRTQHFGAVDVPCLFISGDRDPFGSPEEFSPVTTVWLEGEGHDPKKADAEIVDAVSGWLDDL